MKKALCIILAYAILMTVLVVAPFTVNADVKNITVTGSSPDEIKSGTTGDCTWKIEGTKLTISGNGKMGSYGDKESAPWYSYYSWRDPEITEVVIEQGVTTIGKSAFSYCRCLTNISIPDTVKGIGNYAFQGCAKLSNINIPKSVVMIGSSAFSGCSSLTNITIPDSVNIIDRSTFSECTGLTNVIIPDSVTWIGSSAFHNCISLKSIVIPDFVTSIEWGAFYGCTGLTSVTIPNSVTSIGGSAFSGCTALTSVTIPNSVTSIGSSTFYGCKGLTNVSIGNSVTSIGYQAFYNCENLKSVTIPSNVTSIDGGKNNNSAFGYYYDVDFEREFKVSGFTIYGYKGTEAERYANSHGFTFVDLDGQPTEPTQAPTTPTFDPTKTTDRDILGDMDGDGAISIVDSTFIQRYLIGAQTPYPIGGKIK